MIDEAPFTFDYGRIISNTNIDKVEVENFIFESGFPKLNFINHMKRWKKVDLYIVAQLFITKGQIRKDMFKIWLFIFGFICVSNAYSQPKVGEIKIPDKGQLKVSMPDQNDFGKSSIVRIFHGYDSNKLSYVKFYYNESDSTKEGFLNTFFKEYSKAFDLNFPADSLMLAKLYPDLRFPEIPIITPQTIYRKADNRYHYDIAEVSRYRDSTLYLYTRGYDMSSDPGYGMPVKYKGDIKDLEKHIAKEVNTLSFSNKVDSVLIFQGVISSKGSVELEKLLYGTKSEFSDIVQKIILQSSKWSPAIHAMSGRPLTVRIKIFVQLTESGAISVKIPKQLYNFTGD